MRKSFLALMALGILPVSSAALVSTSAPAFANEVFTDNTFNLADYTSSPVFTSAGTSLTYNQCASCGNPGEGLQLIATFPPGTGSSAAVGLANNTFSYDPLTQGAISSVNASVDKNFTDNYPFLGTGNCEHLPPADRTGRQFLHCVHFRAHGHDAWNHRVQYDLRVGTGGIGLRGIRLYHGSVSWPPFRTSTAARCSLASARYLAPAPPM